MGFWGAKRSPGIDSACMPLRSALKAELRRALASNDWRKYERLKFTHVNPFRIIQFNRMNLVWVDESNS